MESVAKNYYTYTRAMPGSLWNFVQLKRRNSSTGRQNGEASEFQGVRNVRFSENLVNFAFL